MTTDNPARPGRVVGIDLGSRRIGIAVSDPQGTFAFPHGTIERTNVRDDVAAIVEIARERNAKTIVVGNGFDRATEMGPLISAQHLAKVEKYIADGIAEGAKLVCGGARPPEFAARGNYLLPTIFSETTPQMRIVREAEEKATRMQKDAEFLLEQERKQVRMDLQREAVQAALVAAEALLRGKLTMADQERVAEEFLATLVPAKAGSVTSGSSTGGAA